MKDENFYQSNVIMLNGCDVNKQNFYIERIAVIVGSIEVSARFKPQARQFDQNEILK